MPPRVRWTRGEISLLVKRCLELSPHLAWLPSKELVKLLAQAQDCLPENRQQVRIRARKRGNQSSDAYKHGAPVPHQFLSR